MNTDDITYIFMNSPIGDCCICGNECTMEYSVGYCCGPTLDEIGSMSTEYKNSEVGGMCACKECHDAFYGINPLTHPKLHKDLYSRIC